MNKYNFVHCSYDNELVLIKLNTLLLEVEDQSSSKLYSHCLRGWLDQCRYLCGHTLSGL